VKPVTIDVQLDNISILSGKTDVFLLRVIMQPFQAAPLVEDDADAAKLTAKRF